MATTLNPQQIDEALQKLEDRRFEGDALKRRLKLPGFKEAIEPRGAAGFRSRGPEARHPDLHNVYNTVGIALCAHDTEDKATEKDGTSAQAIDRFNRTSRAR